MRQTHVAGEKLFVDFAGDTVPVFDAGPARRARPRSSSRCSAHRTTPTRKPAGARRCRTGSAPTSTRFAFLGGVPKLLVCDNLKAGVTTACRYEPGINRTYQEMAAHYGTTVLPTRPRKPRDKAKVEVAVLIVERWILARLRNRRFFSLSELNEAIREPGR